MTAGAGANLNQQFGMPIWVGAFLCTALTIFVSLLDFKKIIGVIGVFTPSDFDYDCHDFRDQCFWGVTGIL